MTFTHNVSHAGSAPWQSLIISSPGAALTPLSRPPFLEKKGKRVLVLERNDRIGGCLRTEEITAPGFIHDVMATTMVLFLTSPAYGVIGKDLEARGLSFCHCDLPTGVLRPDGSHLALSWIGSAILPRLRPWPMETARRLIVKWHGLAQMPVSSLRCWAAICGPQQH